MSRVRRLPWLELGLAGLLFLLALSIRVYGLRQWPPGLYNDEAANGIDALAVLKGHWPVFFERNFGREPLFIYLQALTIAAFGPNAYALRLTAALIGSLTIPAVYWMTREMFARSQLSSRWLAGWTASFLAVSYWHISLSRIGFRAIMVPLMAALAFGWFWRAWWKLADAEKQQRGSAQVRSPLGDLVLCGVFAGAGLYTYTAARFIPLVIAIVALVGTSLALEPRPAAKRVGLALAVILGTALIVFIPLGAYFLSHPGSFAGRTASVSILSPGFAGGKPLASLASSAVELAKMFVTTPDPNLRHNPAQRPVFDLLQAVWLGIGLVVVVVRWRNLPYFFAIVWLFLLCLPAVLTSEGLPHSLRAIGILPVAILIAVLGMLAVGQSLLSQWRKLALLAPLPFLLFSAFVNLSDYFRPWKDLGRFRDAFQTDLVALADRLISSDAPDTVWIFPMSPNYRVSDAEFYTLAFLNGDMVGTVLTDEQQVSADLAEATNGKRFAKLVDTQVMGETDLAYVAGDPKHLLRFILDKYAQRQSEVKETDFGLSLTQYQLPPSSDYQVAGDSTPVEAIFGNKIKTVGVDYGRTAASLNEPQGSVESKTLPAGQALWIVLHWQPLVPIDVDLKASLSLKDQFGNVAGQVDDLLVGDRYPRERVWAPGETAGTYHILPTLPAIAPGRYGLYLKVYEDQTLRTYPVINSAGAVQGADTLLGYVDVTPSPVPGIVSPTTSLSPATSLGPDLELLGYDLPDRDARPGQWLPLTLYWQAKGQPSRDYAVRVELRDSAGKPILVQEMNPANDTYPTSQWQSNEILRDWWRVPITAAAASGAYDLVVSVVDGQQALAVTSLGQVTVHGRPRLTDPPRLAQPLSATFDDYVALLGMIGPEQLHAAPGDRFELTLAWQVLAAPDNEIVRFVHLLNSEGQPVSQSDGIPCYGDCLPTSWLPGEVLTDEISLEIPGDLQPGVYSLGVGWYDPATLQRFEARDARGQPVPNGIFPLPALNVKSRDQ